MNKNIKGLKALKALKASKVLKGLKALKAPKYGKQIARKGGQFPMPLQQQNGLLGYIGNQQAQPGQSPLGQPSQQPAGQQGFIGTALTDLKNNKEMFQPVYDTTSSIGLVYTFGVAILISIIAALLIFSGYMVNSYYYKYTNRVKGRVVSAKCYTETNNKQRQKKCDVIIEYEVAGKKYKNNYMADQLVNVNESVDVNYEPTNPNNFTTKYDFMLYFGWGLIIFACIMLFLSWGWFILSWMFKPIAAASGIGAIGSALTPNH
jgi:uncharacterized protein YxeA